MRRLLVSLLVLTLALSALFGCSSSKKAPPEPAKQPESSAPAPSKPASPYGSEITIGVITSLTGSEAAFGEAHQRGYQLALDEINAAGGILGAKLKLQVEDDASKPDNAMSAVEKLATQAKLPLILGAYSSGATLPAAQTATKYQVPFIVPTAAADNITAFGSKYVFRINSPSSEYAATAINFLLEQAKPASLAIIYENTNFGTSTAEPAKKLAEARGIKVTDYEGYAKGAPDFKPLLNKVKGHNPDAVLYVSYLLDATLLMRQGRELDFNPRVSLGAGAGFSAPEFIRQEGAGKDAEYTFSATLWTSDVKWKGAVEFNKKFKEKFGVDPAYHSAEAHAALYLVKDVLERAKSPDREAIRSALAATNMAPDSTIFGPMKFNEKGQNAHPMLVTQVQNGQYVTVWPADYAAAKPIVPAPEWSKRK